MKPKNRPPLSSRDTPGTDFCWSLSGPMFHTKTGRIMSIKIDVKPQRMETATFRLVERCVILHSRTQLVERCVILHSRTQLVERCVILHSRTQLVERCVILHSRTQLVERCVILHSRTQLVERCVILHSRTQFHRLCFKASTMHSYSTTSTVNALLSY